MHVHVCVPVCVCARMHVSVHASVCVCMFAHVWVYVYGCWELHLDPLQGVQLMNMLA